MSRLYTAVFLHWNFVSRWLAHSTQDGDVVLGPDVLEGSPLRLLGLTLPMDCCCWERRIGHDKYVAHSKKASFFSTPTAGRSRIIHMHVLSSLVVSGYGHYFHGSVLAKMPDKEELLFDMRA